MTEVLYMSYDGMTDPLGQSQVIPYLEGLSKLGFHFTLISFEKRERFNKSRNQIAEQLKQSNIDWVPLSYTKKPPIFSTVYDVIRLQKKAFKLHRQKNFSIVHCRSYISSLVGLTMKKKFAVKFIFDMRGFYADERVDGGLWKLNNPLYKMAYDFFKRKEKQFLSNADYTISLTENGKHVIHSWKEIPNQPISIEVIPCCADLEKFSRGKVDEHKLSELRKEFSIDESDFILSYLGSVGTWYMLDEMLDFFKCLLQKKPTAKFLFITNEPKELILRKVREKGIPVNKLIITSAPHPLVPTYLGLSSASIFFIKPVFSKSASSPTKQGEIMGMGIPHICNSGVGDIEVVVDEKTGVLIHDFKTIDYQEAIQQLLSTEYDRSYIQHRAESFFSVLKGIEKYKNVYLTIQ